MGSSTKLSSLEASLTAQISISDRGNIGVLTQSYTSFLKHDSSNLFSFDFLWTEYCDAMYPHSYGWLFISYIKIIDLNSGWNRVVIAS